MWLNSHWGRVAPHLLTSIEPQGSRWTTSVYRIRRGAGHVQSPCGTLNPGMDRCFFLVFSLTAADPACVW